MLRNKFTKNNLYKFTFGAKKGYNNIDYYPLQ